MKRYRNKVLQGIALAFGVVVVLIVLADGRELLRHLRDFPPLLLVPIFLLKMVNWAFRYMEWHYLLGVVGVKTVTHGETSPGPPPTIRLRDNIPLFIVGFPMAMSPGKAAEVLKAAIVKNLTGTPITRTAPVVLAERVVDGLAVLIIIGIAGLLGGDAVFKDIQSVDASYLRAVLIFTLIAMAAGIGIIQMKPLALWVIGQIEEIPRIHAPILALYESSYEVLRIKRFIPTVGFGLVAYGTDCIALYIMLRGFGIPGSPELFAQASFILGFAVIVAALSAMPGGAGARELSVTALLIGIIGVEDDIAQVTTLMNSFFQVGLGVLVGVVMAIIFRRMLFPPALDDILLNDGPLPLEAVHETG